ncbi:uncharacterized protein N0V89_004374, partial [Didymosphaeria variabile]
MAVRASALPLVAKVATAGAAGTGTRLVAGCGSSTGRELLRMTAVEDAGGGGVVVEDSSVSVGVAAVGVDSDG